MKNEHTNKEGIYTDEDALRDLIDTLHYLLDASNNLSRALCVFLEIYPEYYETIQNHPEIHEKE